MAKVVEMLPEYVQVVSMERFAQLSLGAQTTEEE